MASLHCQFLVYKGLTTRTIITITDNNNDDVGNPFDTTDANAGREDLPANIALVVDPVDDDAEMPGLIVDQEKMNQFQT